MHLFLLLSIGIPPVLLPSHFFRNRGNLEDGKFPKPYRNWMRFLALLFLILAVFMIAKPEGASRLGFVGKGFAQNPQPTQYYGCALLGLAVFIGTPSHGKKQVEKIKLATVILYLASLCSVDMVNAYYYKSGLVYLCTVKGFLHLIVRCLIIFICAFFWTFFGSWRGAPTLEKEENESNII